MDRTKPMRNSNIELYRIVLMLIIIAHHYVINSGIMDGGSMSILWTQKVELFSQHNICRENYFLGC